MRKYLTTLAAAALLGFPSVPPCGGAVVATNIIYHPTWFQTGVVDGLVEYTMEIQSVDVPWISIDFTKTGGVGYSIRWKPTLSQDRWEYLATGSGSGHITAVIGMHPDSIITQAMLVSPTGFFQVQPREVILGTTATCVIHSIDMSHFFPENTNVVVELVGPPEPTLPPPPPGGD